MSCKATTIDFCQLIQETFQTVIFKFPMDVSADAFEFKIFNIYGKLMTALPMDFIFETEVAIPEFTLPKNQYYYEIIHTRNAAKNLIFVGNYLITDKPNNCNCTGQTFNVSVDYSDTVVNVQYTEMFYTQNNGGGGSGEMNVIESISVNDVPQQIVGKNVNILIEGGIGQDGKSAYQLALENGFVGTLPEWLESLHGQDGQDGTNGTDGLSAYQIALNNGFVGTEAEWLLSLKGEDGTGTSETPDSIKTKYESNANTNAFTDDEKTKLNNLSDAPIQTIALNGTNLVPDANKKVNIEISGSTPLNVTGGALGYDIFISNTKPVEPVGQTEWNNSAFIANSYVSYSNGAITNQAGADTPKYSRTGYVRLYIGDKITMRFYANPAAGNTANIGAIFSLAQTFLGAATTFTTLGPTVRHVIEYTASQDCYIMFNSKTTSNGTDYGYGIVRAPVAEKYYATPTDLEAAKVELKTKKINSVFANLSGTSPTKNSDGWYRASTVVPNQIGGVTAGCTGFAYDRYRELFMIAQYHYDTSAKILLFRRSDLVDRNTTTQVVSTPFKTLDLTSVLDHIQGIAHDWKTDTYLAIGRQKGKTTQNQDSRFVRISAFGNIIDVVDANQLDGYQPGMIDYDINGNLLFKPNNSSGLFVLNPNTFQILNIIAVSNSFEGLAVNRYNGDVWVAGDDKKVRKFDKNYTFISEYTYQTLPDGSGTNNGNVEGMVIDRDGSLIMAADTYLHGANAMGNALFFFDFENTVNKKRFFDLKKGTQEIPFISSVTDVTNVTSIVVDANFTPIVQSRSAATAVAVVVASNVFSNSITNNNYFQIKIG